MPNRVYLYVEAATGVATMVAVGFVSGLAAGAVSGNRSIVIAASAVGFMLPGLLLAVRLRRMTRQPPSLIEPPA